MVGEGAEAKKRPKSRGSLPSPRSPGGESREGRLVRGLVLTVWAGPEREYASCQVCKSARAVPLLITR
jgi:hypothetical protein